MRSVETLERFRANGQRDIVKAYECADASVQASLDLQLAELDPVYINSLFKSACSSKSHESGEIQPLPASSNASAIDSAPEDLKAWRELGLNLIREGKVAIILLAGGQGTRLGSSAPKGCYDIGLPSHKSLFQLQAERIAKVLALANGFSLPWYIMTSGPTHKATKEFFEANSYFGLARDDVSFFEQAALPCLTNDGQIILESADRIAVAPGGNGGIYKALRKAGVLEDMSKRGIEHIQMYCVDNSLVKVGDPTFIGFSASKNADIATKVVRKRDAQESVGLVVSRDGKPAVVEYSETSSELMSKADPSDPSLLWLRAANIVNHYYSMEFLVKNIEAAENIPFHVAKKKIPFFDPTSKTTVKPQTPNGIKLEQFVFDIFPLVPLNKFFCYEVSRSDEFSPVKNGPGAGVDCPETARDDLLREGERWLHAAGHKDSRPTEIAPKYSYAGEGLESYTLQGP